jgi:periplasmic divalent cation tolerance protein
MNTTIPPFLEVTTTVPSMDVANTIARALIERQLAACVQISGPITSVYRWRGALETSTEHRLTAKTTAEAQERLMVAIVALHPYDVPEVLAAPVTAGHAEYLAWLAEQVK